MLQGELVMLKESSEGLIPNPENPDDMCFHTPGRDLPVLCLLGHAPPTFAGKLARAPNAFPLQRTNIGDHP